MDIHWYQMTAAAVLQELGSDAHRGLSGSEAESRLERGGPNELVEKSGRSRRQIIWEQLSGILTILLFVAALIS